MGLFPGFADDVYCVLWSTTTNKTKFSGPPQRMVPIPDENPWLDEMIRFGDGNPDAEMILYGCYDGGGI